MLGSLLNFLFPPRCLFCHTPLPSAKEALCKECTAAIPIESTLRCGECFARIPETTKICHRDFPYLLGAASSYHDPRIRTLVHHLKFRHAHAAASTLAKCIEKYFQQLPLLTDSFIVVPMPLSPKRKRERGYNQVELIAQHLYTTYKLPIISDVLLRTTNTKPQSELPTWNERRTNIVNAFSVISPEKVRSQNCLLLDDVSTSGATFFEAATTLKRAGAHKIIALAAARAR